jgi:lysyl-tRNA synthetase class 2
MSRVFEINRNFRNEGIDATHNPEFTALEAYGINEDVHSLIELVGNMLSDLVHILKRENGLCSNLPFKHVAYNGKSIDFGCYKVVSYQDLYQEGVGRDLLSETDLVAANRRFEEECECLIDPCTPTFVIGYPAIISPLTKQSRDNPLIADRADLFIGGMEIGTIYTEQNDPQVQFDVFSRQIDDADENTHRTMDEDFVEALKTGMPPTGGLGIGIDRLVMLLCDKTSVRDVLAFPFMRPLIAASV